LSEDKIRGEYFADVTDDLTPARRYWSGVASVMLSAMNSSLEKEEVSKRDALWALGSRFPLALDSNDEMTVEEFNTAIGLVEWLKVRAASVGAARSPVRKISGLPEGARKALESLQEPALGRGQIELLGKVAAVLDAIKKSGELTIKLGTPAQNDSFIKVPNDHGFVRVLQGGKPVNSDGEEGTYRIDRKRETEGDLVSLAVPASGKPIEFQFWATGADYRDGKDETAAGILRLPWHGLLALRYGEKVKGGWLLPLEMTSGTGQYKVLVTGLMNPVPKNWPKVKDWNEAGH